MPFDNNIAIYNIHGEPIWSSKITEEFISTVISNEPFDVET